MKKEVVIVGAVALGPKVACRLRRLDPEANITLIDRDNLISYGGCGIPYYVGGDVNDIEDLYKTSSHAIRDQEFFDNCKGINVLTRVEVLEVDRYARKLKIHHLQSGNEEELVYDKLVIATGASPVIPPFPGTELPRVFTVANLHDAESIKKLMAQGKVGSAVVIGAGAIGLEISEALTDLWGIKTTLVEMEDQVLPALLGKDIARITEKEMEKKGVNLLLSERVLQITEDKENHKCIVKTSGNSLAVDIVILAAGVRPNTGLAIDAGISVGMSSGISVDCRMRTNDPHIYAGGDCVEVKNLVSGENMLMALGSLANRQGRVIATNIHGGQSHFQGAVGTFCIKVFDFGISKAGLTYRQAKETGFDPVYAVVSQADHAHFYPSSEIIYISLLADRKSRKILGVEAAGKNGDAVKARVDAVAVLLHQGVDVDGICTLEIGYAPPFASAMDVINNAGNALDNILEGRNRTVDVSDFLIEFEKKQIKVLDMRGSKEAAPFIEKYGVQWLNIPQDQLRKKTVDIPRDEPLYLLCDTGPRSYEAQVFLSSRGIVDTYNIQGGFAMIMATDPAFI